MIDSPKFAKAAELQTTQWFNSEKPLSLSDLLGRVVVIEAFQMLCPGCVSHGLPQASEVAATFSSRDVVVLGLHCVFEHHEAMQPHALKAFLYEYKIQFPVGVDAPAEPGTGPIPKTMQAYKLGGTPTIVIIDQHGNLRHKHFGRVSDMALGAQITALIAEGAETQINRSQKASTLASRCDDNGCLVDSEV